MEKELSTERIYILDFSTGAVIVRFVPVDLLELDANEIVEKMSKEWQVKESDCQYMVVNQDLLDDNTH